MLTVMSRATSTAAAAGATATGAAETKVVTKKKGCCQKSREKNRDGSERTADESDGGEELELHCDWERGSWFEVKGRFW